MLICYLQMLDTPEEKIRFEQIYLKYRGLMYHVADSVLHNRQDAVHIERKIERSKSTMKKVNISYLAVWAGIPAAAAAILVVLAFTVLMGNKTGFVIAVFAAIGIIVAIPMFLESKMKKMAAALEPGFQAQGFSYQYKFEANNAVYYIDQGGRMGVVYRYNPTELQFVDLSKVANVRVNDGKFGMGTSRVSCEFLLDGKKVRITTLQVSRGTLSMKDNRVREAISKADQLCNMLNTAKANAKD